VGRPPDPDRLPVGPERHDPGRARRGTRAALLAGFDAIPTTLCHRDPGLDNLRLRARGTELVLFDWALAGVGPVGEDLGSLLAAAVRRWPEDPYRLARRLLTAYLAGVASSGGPGVVEAAAVWRTAVTTAALREAIFAAAQLSAALVDGDGAGTGRLARFAADASAVEVLAAKALRLRG
jgi:aminoglycoside phosphotransferase (APT) family kinase protein